MRQNYKLKGGMTNEDIGVNIAPESPTKYKDEQLLQPYNDNIMDADGNINLIEDYSGTTKSSFIKDEPPWDEPNMNNLIKQYISLLNLENIEHTFLEGPTGICETIEPLFNEGTRLSKKNQKY